MPAEKKPKTNESSSDDSGAVPPLPSWAGIAVVVVLVAVIGMMMLSSNAPLTTNQQYISPNASSNPPSVPTPSVPNAYPDSLFTIVASPAEPRAGDDITFTATINPAYAGSNWATDFTFEIWVRQFGNWKIKSCYASPCSFTYDQASIGTIEYLVKRYPTTGSSITEPAAGAYSLNVVSSTLTGDTLAPRATLSHDPFYPNEDQTVTIMALVEDVSGLTKVELYVDDQLVKTCPQQVKILQCLYETSFDEIGAHTYYTVAVDTYGNTGTSDPAQVTVLAN